MIHIVGTGQDVGDEEVEGTETGPVYSDIKEKYPWTGVEVPGNPNIILHIHILHALRSNTTNEPQHHFFVEYMTLGKPGYQPTGADVREAYQYTQSLIDQNLTKWSNGEAVLAEIVKPTEETLHSCLAALKNKITSN